MNTPNYFDYSLSELLECEKNINGEKFPERLEIIKKEISIRKEAGEANSEPWVEEFLTSGVPLSIGIRAWWLFLWRSTLATLIFALIFGGFYLLLNSAFHFPSQTAEIYSYVIGITTTPIIGTFIMMQVFSKRYQGYRIYIRKVNDNI